MPPASVPAIQLIIEVQGEVGGLHPGIKERRFALRIPSPSTTKIDDIKQMISDHFMPDGIPVAQQTLKTAGANKPLCKTSKVSDYMRSNMPAYKMANGTVVECNVKPKN